MNSIANGIDNTSLISVEDVQLACHEILQSNAFLHAPCMTRLLSFLVDQAISGRTQDTCEYAIGIEVFNRKPNIYNTSEDPIVRVQVGRLRCKLRNYYANSGKDADIEIIIPLGSYMPVIRRKKMLNNDFTLIPMFAIHPFKCLSHNEFDADFTHGLHAELAHQLFKAFGRIVVEDAAFAPDISAGKMRAPNQASRVGVNHRLEGSVQIDSKHIRTSVQLIDTSAGCIAWSEQFKRKASLAIESQEELATSICCALKIFFEQT